MTPAQMLARIPPAPGLGAHPPKDDRQRPPGDHVIKILEPPASEGGKFKRSELEPWMVEQLDKGSCPICMHDVLHMHCTVAPDFDFYTCEADSTHKWTLVRN